jgi:hypothetical protein
VHADAHRNSGAVPELLLQGDGRLHRLDGAVEDTECTVSVVLEDFPVASAHCPAQRTHEAVPLRASPILVLLHERRVADHVREHDGG